MEYNGLVAMYLFNAVFNVFWIVYFWRVLDGRKYSTPKTLFLSAILIAVYLYFPTLLPSLSLARVLLAPVGPIVYAFTLFKGKPAKKLIAAFAAVCSEVFVEMLFSVAAASMEFDSQISAWTDPRSLIIGFMLVPTFAATLFLVSLIFTKSKNILSAKQILIFSVFPITQAISIVTLQTLVLNPIIPEYIPMLIIFPLIFIVADIFLYRTFIRTEQRVQLEITNKLLENQLDSQLAHYDALTEQYENIRAMRHDIYHHLNTINILLQEGKHDEASEYAELLIPMQQYISKLGECQNPIVDAFLYSRIEEAEAKGITVYPEIVLPASLPISNTDLIVLFANLMDNAIEACSALDNADIRITAKLAKGYLAVYESNPLREINSEKARRIPELERGVGFRILEDLASRYDGSFTHEIMDNRFEASVILKATTNVSM